MKRTKTVRSMAAGLAAAMAFAGLGMGVALTANAADDDSGVVATTTANPNAVKTGDDYTLTIHKLTPSSSPSTAGNGKKLAANPEGSKPIGGVTFKIQKVEGIDLTTNDGWKKAATLAKEYNANKAEKTITGDPAGTKYNLATAVEVKTGQADGIVEKSGLSAGLYYVTEVPPSGKLYLDGTEQDENFAKSLTPVAPFLVTLPMTDPEAKNAWMDNVHVYPKNQPNDLTKEVVDSGSPSLEPEPINTYKIKYGLPKGVPGYKQFFLVDRYTSTQMEWQTAGNSIKLVNSAGDDVVTLNEETDNKTDDGANDYYFVKAVKGTYTYVTAVFTKNGRDKLITNRDTAGAEKVVWELKAKLSKLPSDDTYADITNETFPIPTDPTQSGGDWKPTTPPDTVDVTPTPVTTKYGSVKITKSDSVTSSTKLQGAEFDVYKCGNDLSLGDKVEVAKVVTNASGEATIKGLLLNDWENGKKIDATNKYYCLVETKAPEGYTIAPQPFKFQILSTDVDSTKVTPVDFGVTNVKNNGGFELPITGGNGIVLIVISGGLLVAGSLFYAISSARKNRKES